MGISYNPSSFDTNKTILQAIEELKKYLMTNPLACIYQVPGSVTADLRQLYLTSIVIPTGQEIKAGDIVVAMNGYFNFVDSVGTSEVYFADNWCNLSLDVQSITLNFDPIYGEIVDTPANFTAWIYRRFPRSNDRYYRGRQYYLEISYKDSTAFPTTQTSRIDIPCNYLNAIWYQLNNDNSTTIYFDFTEDVTQQIYQLTNFTIPAGQDGTNGTDGISITGATIDASNHLILTLSDGNTIDAGALPVASGFSNYVEINTTSGTFTDDEFAKLQFNDSVIAYDNGTYKTIYKKKIETSSIIEFEAIDGASRQNLKLIDVNKGTKAFSSTGVSMITSATFDSGNATLGKVLTANGSGGTSWEDAGGGTLNEYTLSLARNDLNTEATRQRLINIVRNAKKVFATLNFYDNGMCYIPLAISQGYGAAYVEMSGTGIYYFGGYKLVSAYIQIRSAAIQSQRVIVLKAVDNVNDQPIVDFSDIPSASSRWEIRYWNETEILS